MMTRDQRRKLVRLVCPAAEYAMEQNEYEANRDGFNSGFYLGLGAGILTGVVLVMGVLAALGVQYVR